MANVSSRARILTTPKAGHTGAENEDAAAVSCSGWPIHAAVTDGATEAAFSRVWAQILATHSVEEGVVVPSEKVLAAWRETWHTRIAPRIQSQPWYVAAKVEEGAYATYLHLKCSDDGRWQAARVGDCVLFHLRDSTLKRSWPAIDAISFDHRPSLVSTRPNQTPEIATQTGTWQPGDRFLLATDAAAAWMLDHGAERALTWTSEVFSATVDEARQTGALRNDDTTVLVLALDA